MFKSELWQNHDEYRTMVNQVSRRLLRNNPKYLFSSMRRSSRCFLAPTSTLSRTTSPLFTPTPAGPPDTRLRSCVPSFFLLCSSTGPKQRPALLYGVLRLFSALFPWRSSLTTLPWATFPPLGSYYDFMDRFWLGAQDSYFRSSLLPAGKMAKNLKRTLALTANWKNRKPPPPLPRRTSSVTSWMVAPLRETLRWLSRESFSFSPSSLPCGSDSLIPLLLLYPAMVPPSSPMPPLSAAVLHHARLPAPS